MKIVMFSQTTCGPCRQLLPHLKAATQQLGYDVEIWTVDDNWPLCQQYGVTYTPTVIVLHDNDTFTRLETTDPKQQPPNAFAIKAELEQHV
jgi:thioredoxin-like negative regulator of GroEL